MFEDGDDVVDRVLTKRYLTHGLCETDDADARDDDIGWSSVEGERASDVVDFENVPLEDCEVGFDGELVDATGEEDGGEFGGGACYW